VVGHRELIANLYEPSKRVLRQSSSLCNPW
jgi:hypothetical protein